jgi:hypothetical protein
MSTPTDRLKIGYGRMTYPDTARAVWGARLIWPNDLVWDRQDIAAWTGDDKDALVAWLNGPNRGNGALRAAIDVLADPYNVGLESSTPSDVEAVIYEDDRGVIVGSPQGSYGYVYVAAWLKH